MQSTILVSFLNASIQHPQSYFKKGIEYHCVDLIDTKESKISPFFDETAEFISKTIENGNSVLVHCSQG
jgi:protein-tyrosine phosphatase